MYRAVGNQIHHNGQRIQLHGGNLIGMEWANVIDGLYAGGTSIPKFLDLIKAWKWNHVRLPVVPNVFRNVDVSAGATGADWKPESALLKGKKSLDILDFLIEELERRGIRFYLDHHYLETDRSPKIPHRWYTDRYSEGQYFDDIEFMAKCYEKRAGFVGIDLKNEPNKNGCTWGDGKAETDWKIASYKAFERINKANQKILTIVEGLEADINIFADSPSPIPHEFFVPSIHVYFSDVWGQYVNYFGSREECFKKWDQMMGRIVEKHPVLIGEWGGYFGTNKPLDKQNQEWFVEWMNSKGGMNHSYWCISPNSGDTGGIFADGGFSKLREDKLANIEKARTASATLSSDTPPKPVDPIPAVPTPTPTPTGKIGVGSYAKLIFLSEPPVDVLITEMIGNFAKVVYVKNGYIENTQVPVWLLK